MGGNALKNCDTWRIPKVQYDEMKIQVTRNIQAITGGDVHVIDSYRLKEDFGDMDVLVRISGGVTKNHIDELAKLWGSKEVVRNNDCTSFELDGFQIDVISRKSFSEYSFSRAYFAWNDLGNLMGRIAHKMGLKFGHDKMSFFLRDGTHYLEEVTITTNPEEAIKYLGFDVHRWKKGFDSLEEIFQFVADNPRFNPDIYLLDQVNAIARVRDKKRKTYMAFLEWCERYKEANPDRKYFVFPEDKTVWLKQYRVDFPHFRAELDAAHAALAWKRYLHSKFNGDIVAKLTNLEGKRLGQFIQFLYSTVGGRGSKAAENWIIDTPDEIKTTYILNQLSIFQQSLV